MDPSVYFVETVLRCKVKSFFLSVDRGRDDPGVHGGDHLQQAGAPQEARLHPHVQQERRRLPARWHQLPLIQVLKFSFNVEVVPDLTLGWAT